ncbi:hypothetical protein GCM10023224_14670 [Streptomonospora halophila]|uniref:DUF5753 domain-containing protein n=1 Tax=Streptomonospora halophila TaxID=427369 RepID=A0ABP9GAM4_9ACTN
MDRRKRAFRTEGEPTATFRSYRSASAHTPASHPRLGSWTFPGQLDSPIAWIGMSACRSVFLDQHGETERYTVTSGDLQGFALSTKRTAEFIADVAASPGE